MLPRLLLEVVEGSKLGSRRPADSHIVRCVHSYAALRLCARRGAKEIENSETERYAFVASSYEELDRLWNFEDITDIAMAFGKMNTAYFCKEV
jgi:hypothetical protein